MAKERVQVQGLGRQTPSIRPTIQGVGSFNIATPTAPRPLVPQSNKLIDLANTLKAGQGLLQQYGLAAQQEAEIFEDELSRKALKKYRRCSRRRKESWTSKYVEERWGG